MLCLALMNYALFFCRYSRLRDSNCKKRETLISEDLCLFILINSVEIHFSIYYKQNEFQDVIERTNYRRFMKTLNLINIV